MVSHARLETNTTRIQVKKFTVVLTLSIRTDYCSGNAYFNYEVVLFSLKMVTPMYTENLTVLFVLKF
jgi:hypothetical protein